MNTVSNERALEMIRNAVQSWIDRPGRDLLDALDAVANIAEILNESDFPLEDHDALKGGE